AVPPAVVPPAPVAPRAAANCRARALKGLAEAAEPEPWCFCATAPPQNPPARMINPSRTAVGTWSRSPDLTPAEAHSSSGSSGWMSVAVVTGSSSVSSDMVESSWLLMSQGVDRAERGGPVGGVEPEEHSDGHGDAERQNDG